MKSIVFAGCMLLYLMSFTFAQGIDARLTRTQTERVPQKKDRTTLLTEAEKAWAPFFAKFSRAVRSRDYQLLKEMTVKYVDCGIEEPNGEPYGDEDLRDICILDWKKSKEDNVSKVGWNDFIELLSKKAGKLWKDKNWRDNSIAVYRSIALDNRSLSAGAGRAVFFIYTRHAWYLERFKMWEETV